MALAQPLQSFSSKMSNAIKRLWTETGASSIDYDQLPVDEEGISEKSFHKSISITRWKAGMLVLSLLATIVVASVFVWPRQARTEPSVIYNAIGYGATNYDAKVRGCVMEPMIYGWVPKECYYEDLSSQYSPFEDREWYTDETFQERVAPSELWAGEREHVYTHRYHAEHCLFLWRKLARAVDDTRRFVDTKALSVQHVDHCSESILTGREGGNSTNDVILGFYECGQLPWQ